MLLQLPFNFFLERRNRIGWIWRISNFYTSSQLRNEPGFSLLEKGIERMRYNVEELSSFCPQCYLVIQASQFVNSFFDDVFYASLQLNLDFCWSVNADNAYAFNITDMLNSMFLRFNIDDTMVDVNIWFLFLVTLRCF